MIDVNALKIDNSTIGRRIMQAVCDIAHRPLNGLRILDLGSAHGAYSIEMAKLGAQVLGIEGRAAWLEQANRTKQALGLANVEFVQDDARNLSVAKYGEFDIVLCLGLLYHLDAPDGFAFMQRVAEVCRDFAIVETHFAATATEAREWRGKQYWGFSAFEHAARAPAEEKLKNMGASLDNEQAFWMTQPSLWNLLRHVGFTSVFDCRIPMASLYIGEERDFKIWGNRVTLAAIKGQPVKWYIPDETVDDWPESLDGLLFERYIQGENAPAETPPDPRALDTRSGGIRGLVRRLLQN